MREEELWDWRIKWKGHWTTTIDGATEAEMRLRHPEAERIEGSRFVRRVNETGGSHVKCKDSEGTYSLGESKYCGNCQHWGGWVQVQFGMQRMQISYRTHGKCLRAGLSRGITQPDNGCAFWSQKQEAKIVDMPKPILDDRKRPYHEHRLAA
jgi:hypothetical protein